MEGEIKKDSANQKSFKSDKPDKIFNIHKLNHKPYLYDKCIQSPIKRLKTKILPFTTKNSEFGIFRT